MPPTFGIAGLLVVASKARSTPSRSKGEARTHWFGFFLSLDMTDGSKYAILMRIYDCLLYLI